MGTFILGIVLLFVGAAVYGAVCEKVMKPTDRKTPAVEKYDGVDFVPMKKWRNSLVQLLNIAGTGPIIGPIQGILFGPIAFITIPIGCVIGGAFHDYMCGMLSVRNGGSQMQELVRRFLGKYVHVIYTVLVCLVLLLITVSFIYTPGDLFVTHFLPSGNAPGSLLPWIVYSVIFLYFIIATFLPIDKIIGRIYPVFGAVLLFAALGVLIGLFTHGYRLDELWETGFSFVNSYGDHFIPIFFVTVTCGILSGFHSTQATLISRTMKSEREGRMTFYNMMILEGFVAMIWSAAAMGALNGGLVVKDMLHNHPTTVISVIAKDMLGNVGSVIAIIGIILFPITTGDTALRSLRLILTETFRINRSKKRGMLILAFAIFSAVAALLYFTKIRPDGFSFLWRYFFWANESTSVVAFAMIAVYMIRNRLPHLMALIPGMFYMFVVTSYIAHAPIGFRLSWRTSYVFSAMLTLAYGAIVTVYGRKTAGIGVRR